MRLDRVMIVLQSTALGGMESHCVHLASEMARRGTTVLAVVPESPMFDGLAASLSGSGARVDRIDTDARRGRLSQITRVARFMGTARSFDPDVVHLHVGGATGGLAPVACSRLVTNAVVAVTEHDVPSTRPGLRQRVNRYFLDRGAHVIVAISRHNASLRIKRLGVPQRKFAVVINGTPLPHVPPGVRAANRARVRRELGIGRDVNVIGSVVRLAEGKGLPTLFKAFAVVAQHVEARLLLVGSGPLEARLTEMAQKLGLTGKVMMVGHKSDPGPLVDTMDVFVLPVPMGSGSIALLEAMGRGVPPVITFGDGEEPVVPEITGIWSPPEDPEALGAVLVRLSRDRALRERLGLKAEHHVHSHFSIERVVDDLTDVYAVARKGPIPAGLKATDPSDRNPGTRTAGRLAAHGQA